MNQNNMMKLSGLTGGQLKLIAIITMVIDHVGAVLFPGELIFRYIGRVSFPIFCFLLVEGFIHTRNVQKYMIRLGIFAVLSEIPYDLAFYETLYEFEHQNVFFTLCIAVGILYIIKYVGSGWEKGIAIACGAMLAEVIHADYGMFGIFLIIWFYMMYDDKAWKLAGGAIWSFYNGIGIQSYAAFAMIPIGFYNGKRGIQLKYIFYFFYPVHLFVLYLCNHYIL